MVLPLVNKVIIKLEDTMAVKVGDTVVPAHKLAKAVRAGRKKVHADLFQRWVTDLQAEPVEGATVAAETRTARKTERLRKLAISTVLDPRFNKFKFKGSGNYDKEKVMQWVREEYMAHYVVPVTQKKAAEHPKTPVSDKRKHSLLFDSDDDDASDDEAPELLPESDDEDEDPHKKSVKQLEKYLELKQAPPDTAILDWWFQNEAKYPCVCKMWRQFHGRPASSAGVERLFSGAWKMHGKDAQTMKSETIQQTLGCSVNYNPWFSSVPEEEPKEAEAQAEEPKEA
ncbi:hypothetical protein CYMTET_52142 [Cymbomonas tetramitiformis]|uniref:HAT C-terminal dimerisation domain-containing protein n=1 Tax=Cymbomonas tetramitiformis TaxID=36881 RepID=A0AAE0BJL0_9CHLO|nr:hypothetical protein CYMTET_52142 [Cymbomonas tetramitiformis]